MKDKLSFVKINDIETEMKRIEERMAHTTLSLDEEKRHVSQLAALNKSRDVVKGFGARQEQLNADEANRKDIVEKMKQQDSILTEIKQRESVLQQQMAAVRKKEESVSGDVPNLIAEREACIANIKEIRTEIRKLRDAFREQENQYYAREREFREQYKKEKEEKRLQFLEERKKRDEERRRRELENAPPPFYKEITICEQLLAYLSKFLPQEDQAKDANDIATAGTSEDASGLVLKKRTEDGEDMDSMFSGTGGKKKKKKGGKKKTNDTSSLTPTTKLPHSIETYTSFSTISVSVPITVADVQPAIDAIKEKNKEFEELAKVEAEKRAAQLIAAAEADVTIESNGEQKGDVAAASNGDGAGESNGSMGVSANGESDAPKADDVDMETE